MCQKTISTGVGEKSIVPAFSPSSLSRCLMWRVLYRVATFMEDRPMRHVHCFHVLSHDLDNYASSSTLFQMFLFLNSCKIAIFCTGTYYGIGLRENKYHYLMLSIADGQNSCIQCGFVTYGITMAVGASKIAHDRWHKTCHGILPRPFFYNTALLAKLEEIILIKHLC
jgi:hypothetical protein